MPPNAKGLVSSTDNNCGNNNIIPPPSGSGVKVEFFILFFSPVNTKIFILLCHKTYNKILCSTNKWIINVSLFFFYKCLHSLGGCRTIIIIILPTVFFYFFFHPSEQRIIIFYYFYAFGMNKIPIFFFFLSRRITETAKNTVVFGNVP